MLKTTSSKSIIAKLYRDLRIEDTFFVSSAIEWIAEGLDYMSIPMTYIQKNKILPITSFKTLLPSDIVQIVDVLYKQDATADSDPVEFTNRMKCTGGDFSMLNQLTQNLYYPSLATYRIEDPYLHTSIESGYLYLLYKGLPVDESNLPLIPDISAVKEALKWNIIRHLMESGWNHPAKFDYGFADAQWQRYCGQGRSEIKMLSVNYELLSSTWEEFITNRTLNGTTNDLVQYTANELNQ
jgi:hypothetical protein